LLVSVGLSFLLVVEAKLTTECLVDYLKFRNISDDALASVDQYAGQPSVCADDVKAKVRDIYGEARMKIESDGRQKPYADCVLKEIEGDTYESLMLKATAIDMKGVGLKFWKISGKNTKVEELKKKAQEVVDGAIIKCKGQIEYGTFFDQFYEQKRTEPINDISDYCMRKHLADKNLIKTSSYNFKVNPKSINTANIDCTEIIRVTTEQMKQSITSVGSQCVIQTFIDEGYIDVIMKIQLLSKLNLSASDKETEKQNFITRMIEMTHKIKSCPMKT